MKKIWVIVADEAIVRVMSRSDIPGAPLDAVQALTDPAAHGKDEAFHHDAHGRRAASAPRGHSASQPVVAAGASATTSAGESGRHIEAEQFARRVAEFLRGALNEGRFDELHIAAAPRFLGLLRKALDPQVAKRVVQSLDKDWTKADDADLAQWFFPRPAAA
jgi:protein required for attachment to host cells